MGSFLQLHSDSISAQRASFKEILLNYGHWAIYRRYDLNSKSKHFDPATSEGVGGERWTYTDKPILIRHDPASVRSTAGVMLDRSKVYLDHTVRPKRGDVIIEIDYDAENRYLTPGLIMQMDHREAFTIDDIAYRHLQGGALVYTTCIVKPRLEAY